MAKFIPFQVAGRRGATYVNPLRVRAIREGSTSNQTIIEFGGDSSLLVEEPIGRVCDDLNGAMD
jgi:hypothetical protein